MKVKSESEVAQACPTLSDPMDCSLPGPSVQGIFQARVLERGAIAFSTSPMAHWLKKKKKNLPAMQEMWVQSLGGEDSMEENMVITHSSILVWEIPWSEESGGLHSMESQRGGLD